MLTRYPPGLISAPCRSWRAPPPRCASANNATAHLWLAQPSRVQGDEATTDGENLFSTHPPIEERIRRLQEM